MDDHNAHRPTGGTVDRADDRAGELIETDSTDRDRHPGDALRHDSLAVVPTLGTFDAVVTSPASGNKMADSYDGRDGSTRSTYRCSLGRPLSPGSGAALQWGAKYRDLHAAIWKVCVEVLRPGGRFVLNTKDHPRGFERQRVTDWHIDTLVDLGLVVIDRTEVETPHFRFGANADARYPEELVVLELAGGAS